MSRQAREGGAVGLAAVVFVGAAVSAVLVRTGVVGNLVARLTGSRVVRIK